MDLHEIARQLSHVTWRGDTFMARCPAHEDRTPSLSGKSGNDGRTLLKCHAGCQTEDVLSELGLSFRALYPTPATVTTPTLRSAPSMPTTYDYRDVDGTLLHQVVRGADKSFRQRSPGSGSNEWVWKASGRRVPLLHVAPNPANPESTKPLSPRFRYPRPRRPLRCII